LFFRTSAGKTLIGREQKANKSAPLSCRTVAELAEITAEILFAIKLLSTTSSLRFLVQSHWATSISGSITKSKTE